MRITKLEIILVLLLFAGIGVFLAVFAGGPIFSDEIAYMNAGLTNIGDPYLLNRYTHIFLQKPFLKLAPTPLQGVKIYWGFVLAATGLLTYWCARILSREGHLLHAGLAAVLFFSFHFFVDYSGVTLVDFTAMLMVMLFIFIYILGEQKRFTTPWLIALGFLFLLAFRAKETTIALLVLIPGLGFLDGSVFQVKTLLNRLRYFFAGLVVGVILFIILNSLILRDPFFGFSPSSIKAFLDSYASLTRLPISPNNLGWYSGIITSIWLLPFALYLISGIRLSEHVKPPLRLLWVVPVALVVFLTIMTLWRSYKIEPRFFFPALPILCFLGTQLIPFKPPATTKGIIIFWISVFIVAFACIAINYSIRPLAVHMAQSFEDFLSLIFYPIAISVLVLSAFFIKRYTSVSILIPVACIISMVFTPIRTNIKYLAVLHQNASVLENRFHPFSAFASQLKPASNMQFYVSSDVHQELNMLSADVNEIDAMYNIYFDRNIRSSEFTISPSMDGISGDMLHGNYTYAFFTLEDWQKMSANPANLTWYQEHYSVLEDSSQPIILLVKK